MNELFYKKSYQYLLENEFKIQTPIKLEKYIITKYIRLSQNGELIISANYAWDGYYLLPKNGKFGKLILVRDAFMQLIDSGFIDGEKLFKKIDHYFLDILTGNKIFSFLLPVYKLIVFFMKKNN